ncbi:rRNA maturation RNase YbeY [Candidatus Phytoplasma prunorum]|uniref:rRNA maturation RNase YbeY n=1 Tax=Candidatus Phytoplasma prunorum TaxID=47565 RepID=UPI002FF25882
MKVKIHNKTDISVKYLTKILKKIFSFLPEKKNIHIIFITPLEMRKMNFYYRQKDYDTDVLSFINEIDKDSLGDIFINLNKAQKQSKNYNHSLSREVGFLVTHGYLHLKGYEHHSEDELKKMLIIQEKMLKKVGLDKKIIFKNKK